MLRSSTINIKHIMHNSQQPGNAITGFIPTQETLTPPKESLPSAIPLVHLCVQRAAPPGSSPGSVWTRSSGCAHQQWTQAAAAGPGGATQLRPQRHDIQTPAAHKHTCSHTCRQECGWVDAHEAFVGTCPTSHSRSACALHCITLSPHPPAGNNPSETQTSGRRTASNCRCKCQLDTYTNSQGQDSVTHACVPQDNDAGS
jgi:hypothetical protein